MADAPQVVIENEGWVRKYWRPAMAWQYFFVCLCDFIIFPLVAVWFAQHYGGEWKWEPLTLKEGGFYHMAMGVIIGVTAWTRGQENIERTKLWMRANPQTSHSGDDVCEDDMYIDESLPQRPRPEVRSVERW